jgi:spore germination protein
VRSVLVVLVSVVSLALAGPAGPAGAAPPDLHSTGYVLGSARTSLVSRDAHALSTLGVDGVTLAANGRSVDETDDGERSLLAAAHTQGLRAELLVSNYSNAIGDFDPRAAARLLRHPDRVQAVATRLASYVAADGWDGVQLDLESMTAGDADGLLQLAQALQAAMPPEKSVSIAVMASAEPQEYVKRGYRLADLGQVVDTMALMTYDQHGPGWSGPGPIGSRRWQAKALAVVLAQVPAAKVDLGVAGYGYTWPTHGTGHTVSVRKARKLAGSRAQWRPGPGEWTARLKDGTRLWWSDGQSYDIRAQMARDAGLHGLAVWQLGSADPLS